MDDDRKKYKVQASNTTNTYVYCFIAAKQALEQAQKQELGRFYSCMVAGIFAAFTFEAYLNHIGQQKKVRDWDIQEKTRGHRDKLKLLKKSLGFTADLRQTPFKSINNIFYLRDSLAHGKTKTISIDKIVKNHQVGSTEYTQVDWKKLCTLPKVTIMVNDVESMIRSIHQQLGIKRDPFASPEGSYSNVTVFNK
jgi:hypothetical protein